MEGPWLQATADFLEGQALPIWLLSQAQGIMEDQSSGWSPVTMVVGGWYSSATVKYEESETLEMKGMVRWT